MKRERLLELFTHVSLFFTYKDQGERSIIVVITKYRQSDGQSTEWKVGSLV